METTLLEDRLVVSLISVVFGVALTLIAQHLVNKRGLFTYFVQHNRIGASGDDAVFGTVRVTWNNTPAAHLYSSIVELRNESLKDYENVVVKVFSNDTKLLTERSEIVGTTHDLRWTNEFADKLAVAPGGEATNEQWTLYARQREYLVPTMNRGQVIRITYLNDATTENQPSLWVDVVHKGVRLTIRTPQPQFMGVSQPAAALTGSAMGVFVLAAVIGLVDTTWIAAIVCMVYGLIVLIPGAMCIRSWRWVRDFVGG